MQLGMIGLGRMGANMVRRLQKGGHQCVVYDRSAESVKQLSAEGATGSTSLDDFAGKLQEPRAIWLMVPAAVVDATLHDLVGKLEKDDVVIDGGNSYYIDDIRRAQELSAKGIHYCDVGTSGGVWGLERGYCQMIGGETDVVKRLDPIFKTLAPGRGNVPRTPGRDKVGGTAEEGYLYCGPSGAGHFVKMVHNGIEYGLMAAYAEGLNILKHANAGKSHRDADAETTPMSLNHSDMHPTPSPCVMVIFGATGDLTKRKLIPALCNLAQHDVLPKQFAIVGFAGNDFDTASFRKMLAEEIPKFASAPLDPKLWASMVERIYYVKGDFLEAETYKRLEQQINEADKKHNALGNRFFYLAVAPRFFSSIAKMLAQCCLSKEEIGHWARVIIEKPFGHDLESAKKLNQELQQVLTEKQIYRIDHYLGKETVQNVMVFRFSNNIIEPLWNRNYVDHVQITAAETVGVEHRGSFYETAGALRDMVPNHLFQL